LSLSAEIADAGPLSPRRRRAKTGLGLLLLATGISLLAYATVGLTQVGHLPSNMVIYSLLITAGYLGAWFTIRFAAPDADPVLFPTAALLAGLGMAMLYRLRPEVASQQTVWLFIGLAVFVVMLLLIRDDRRLDAFTYTIGLAGIVLLLLPIVPGIGYEINGARLWAKIGPISFQPAEFGKILIVVFLASYLAAKRELLAAGVGRFGLPRVKDLGPVALAWATSLVVLFLEKDLGASLLFFAAFVLMVWVATGRSSYLIIGLVLMAVGSFLGYLVFTHVQTRVDYWLNALNPATVHDLGFGQLAQGWFALASGGLVGTGLGQGSPTLIPYVGSDFIFAAFGEELGMIGASALLLLYVVLIGRGLRVALERTDGFGKLLATGLTAIIALQTFVIVAGVTRLIPLTGVPLPLVSYGGSSKVATFAILALLIRTSSGSWERRRG
jgi:cell division protein FtsW (lipid II flippase)